MHFSDDLERYLRQFTPRVPTRPHVDRVPHLHARWQLAAAVLLVCIGLAAVWLMPGTTSQLVSAQPRIDGVTSGALRRAALSGPGEFDASLDAAQPHTLVAVDAPGTVLQTLATE